MRTLGVFASIVNGGRILLVRQAYGLRLWTTPGGAVEHAELAIEALKREVREEIGCEVNAWRFAGVYSKPYRNDIVLSFDVTVHSGTPRCASQEISELGFFDQDNLPLDMAPNSRARILDALERRAFVLRVFEDEFSHGVLSHSVRPNSSLNRTSWRSFGRAVKPPVNLFR